MEISLLYTWRSNFSLGYPLGAHVNNRNIVNYEDSRPYNINFMLRSGANIFVSQILVQSSGTLCSVSSLSTVGSRVLLHTIG